MTKVDEITEDAIRSRAKVLLANKGWLAGDKVNTHSAIELMTALGVDLMREPVTDKCGYPECHCDSDAVCAAALSDPSPQGVTDEMVEAACVALHRYAWACFSNNLKAETRADMRRVLEQFAATPAPQGDWVMVRRQCSCGHSWSSPGIEDECCPRCNPNLGEPDPFVVPDGTVANAKTMRAIEFACSCRGADDYCVCQNVPDAITRSESRLLSEESIQMSDNAEWEGPLNETEQKMIDDAWEKHKASAPAPVSIAEEREACARIVERCAQYLRGDPRADAASLIRARKP